MAYKPYKYSLHFCSQYIENNIVQNTTSCTTQHLVNSKSDGGTSTSNFMIHNESCIANINSNITNNSKSRQETN